MISHSFRLLSLLNAFGRSQELAVSLVTPSGAKVPVGKAVGGAAKRSTPVSFPFPGENDDPNLDGKWVISFRPSLKRPAMAFLSCGRGGQAAAIRHKKWLGCFGAFPSLAFYPRPPPQSASASASAVYAAAFGANGVFKLRLTVYSEAVAPAAVPGSQGAVSPLGSGAGEGSELFRADFDELAEEIQITDPGVVREVGKEGIRAHVQLMYICPPRESEGEREPTSVPLGEPAVFHFHAPRLVRILQCTQGSHSEMKLALLNLPPLAAMALAFTPQ